MYGKDLMKMLISKEVEIKLKKCIQCKEDFPATKEYFHSHNGCKDGLNSLCKKCRSENAAKKIRKTNLVPDGYKQCVECEEILEININNFNLYARSLDGYFNLCIECQIKHRRNGAEEGYKKCKSCENIYPLNKNYFQPSDQCLDGFRNKCLECIGQNFFPGLISESWSNEDINIVKDNYANLTINNIIPLLSTRRTEKAVLHIAQKLGIRKIKNYIEDYNNLKYKIIDNVLNKYCKSCKRYLPMTYDYFPKDITCVDNFRNVCRECKGESFRCNSNFEFWTDEEINLIIEKYPHFSNPELITLFLDKRSISSLEGKAKELNLYKSEETRDRINKMNGNLTSVRKLINEDWAGIDNPQYNSQRFGSMNPNYKGGVSALYQELRRNLKQWKMDSIKNGNYVSFLTGKRFDDIHHLYSFDNIVRDTLSETGLLLYEDISTYSNEEIKQLIDKCIEIHYRHPFGVCLEEKYHIKFHEEFGYGNNTEEQFYEFLENYYNGKYKNL